MDIHSWVSVVSLGSNLALVMIGLRFVRYLSRIELKVDTMWSVFMRKFGTREGEDGFGSLMDNQ